MPKASDYKSKFLLQQRLTCKRRRSIGYKAKDSMEKSMSANTETSVERREARTTDAETAAFIDRTEERLTTRIMNECRKPNSIGTRYPSCTFWGCVAV